MFDPSRYRVSLDSGAFSLYNKLSHRRAADTKYSWVKSAEFKQYVERFVEYVTLNRRRFEHVVTIDILFNPELTYEIWEYLRSCGVETMPVMHFGEDLKWLKRYMDQVDFIGIGGMGNKVSPAEFAPWGNKVFKMLCDKSGKPKWKTHGFAVTNPKALLQYPFYTADSSTWIAWSRTGSIAIPSPVFHRGVPAGFDFLRPSNYRVSSRALHDKNFIDRQSVMVRGIVDDYLRSMFDVSVDDVRESYFHRDVINGTFMVNMSAAVKKAYAEKFDYEEGGNIHLAGQPACSPGHKWKFRKLFGHIMCNMPDNVRLSYLGSFYYLRSVKQAIGLTGNLKRKEIHG